MKYIIFERPDAGLPLPVLFSAPATHAEIAQAMKTLGWKAKSAGYVRTHNGACVSESVSLGIGPARGDAEMIAHLGDVTMRMLAPHEVQAG